MLLQRSVDVNASGVLLTTGLTAGGPDDVTVAFNRGVGGAVEGRAAEFFDTTPPAELGQMGFAVDHDALREAEVSEDEFRLGSLFPSTASRRIPVPGGSHGTPQWRLPEWVR